MSRSGMLAVALLAVGGAALAVYAIAGGFDADEKVTVKPRPEEPREITSLSAGQRAAADRAIRQSALYGELTRGSRTRVDEYVPWVSSSGTSLNGVELEITLRPPVGWTHRRLPVKESITSRRLGIPADRLFTTVTIENVTKIAVWVDLDEDKVLQVSPRNGSLDGALMSPALYRVAKASQRPGY